MTDDVTVATATLTTLGTVNHKTTLGTVNHKIIKDINKDCPSDSLPRYVRFLKNFRLPKKEGDCRCWRCTSFLLNPFHNSVPLSTAFALALARPTVDGYKNIELSSLFSSLKGSLAKTLKRYCTLIHLYSRWRFSQACAILYQTVQE
jgi:hypothetical protein